MDKIIEQFYSVDFNDLKLCPHNGVAYDPHPKPFHYGKIYWEKYIGYEGKPIANRINSARIRLVRKYCKPDPLILDVGIGSGEFIKTSDRLIETMGYDVNPYAVNWLLAEAKFFDPYRRNPGHFHGISLWDVFEHLEDPGALLERLSPGQYVFVSIPIFANLRTDLFQSKHYRPKGEHVTYWEQQGLIDYFGKMGFWFKEVSFAETAAGRENISSFVFQKGN